MALRKLAAYMKRELFYLTVHSIHLLAQDSLLGREIEPDDSFHADADAVKADGLQEFVELRERDPTPVYCHEACTWILQSFG